MRILITGGAGFIGSNLAAYHLNKGDNVVVIDDLSTGCIDNIKDMLKNANFCFHKKNLLTCRGLKDILNGMDRVYHLAAIVGMFHVLNHPIETLKININATLKLVETINKMIVKPLVFFASSSEVYGNQHNELSENSPLIVENTFTNHSAYAISKLSDESIAMAFWHKFQVPCIVLRIFNTVGRNQSSRYGMVLPRLVQQAFHNEPITVFGDGTQRRAFCNINDTVNLMDLLANNKDCIGEIINLGNNEDVCINELALMIKKLGQSSSSILHIPFEKVYHHEYMHIQERRPDLSKLLSFTHYTYQWTIERTIKDLFLYYKIGQG
ncbi:MAG: NAD-dependent epimerase/dehydratase family protein [Legionella sp.]|nr:NAD-dependent epimerase/dehydratase family protein [Legionella sp.]